MFSLTSLIISSNICITSADIMSAWPKILLKTFMVSRDWCRLTRLPIKDEILATKLEVNYIIRVSRLSLSLSATLLHLCLGTFFDAHPSSFSCSPTPLRLSARARLPRVMLYLVRLLSPRCSSPVAVAVAAAAAPLPPALRSPRRRTQDR